MLTRVAVGSVVLAVIVAATGLWLGGATLRERLVDGSLVSVETLSLYAELASSKLRVAIERALVKDPVALIGVAFGLMLPVVGVLAVLLRWSRRMIGFGRGPTMAALVEPAEPPTLASHRPRPGPCWLDVTGAHARRIPLIAEIHRIGRDIDNDLRVAGPDIAATHALIRRTPEHEFHLIDVSGDPRSLLEVNGELKRQVRLRDGDRIGVGGVEAIFHHGYLPSQPGWSHSARPAPESRTTP